MAYRIEIDRSAQKALRGLDGSVRPRVIDAIRALADNPRPPGSTKLVGHEAWRIRVGDYRIVYEIHDQVLLVLIVGIGHRRDIYR